VRDAGAGIGQGCFDLRPEPGIISLGFLGRRELGLDGGRFGHTIILTPRAAPANRDKTASNIAIPVDNESYTYTVNFMPVTISIPDQELDGFSAQAIVDLELSLTTFKNDILAEIGRIEAGQNSGSGVPEITSRMVKDAEMVFSRGSVYKRRKTALIFLKIVAVISIFIAGLMADRESLKDFGFLVAFVIVVAISILSNTLLYLREN
jgi:hypothetical protein